MASIIRRKQTPVSRVITVLIELVSKDASDDALIKKFGDIMINPSGSYGDPSDGTYPKFIVQAGNPVAFFTQQTITATFVNDTLDVLALQKQANLWGDAIVLDIQNKMIALRAFEDTSTIDTTVTI